MKPDKIKELLQKYYEGETSLEEEAQLREYLTNIEQVPEELKADAEIAMMMQSMSADRSNRDLEMEEDTTKVVNLQETNRSTVIQWTMRIAAGLALILLGLFAGWLLGREGSNNSEVAALRDDINEMKELVALNQLQKASASERIMATYEFRKLDSASDEVLDALINRFHNDDNTNVRNAAADALFKFGNQDKVRKAFITGLSSQEDPLLQIKLIDMLVSLDEKRALPKFQDMMQAETQMKVVKQKAAQGFAKLL